MPITTNIQKRARKSNVSIRPPILPSTTTNFSTNRTVCHLCGYVGRTKSISIEKTGYHFLRYLPPATGALSVDNNTHSVLACHLCVLILDKQRELNHTSNNFFFKGFFRSTGSCHNNNNNNGLSTKIPSNEQESLSIENTSSSPNKQSIITEIDQSRAMPPPLRKTSSFPLDIQISDEMSSLDTFLTSIRSRFLSDYTSLLSSSSKIKSYDSCQLCLSIKPHGTLYTIFKNQFEFLSSLQMNVCTLCYYNLIDQYKKQVKIYQKPKAQCYLCSNRLNFIDWEIKFLEIEYLPFLLKFSTNKQLYDNQRLALVCDQCFYTILFQYIDQQRENIPIQQRTYTWQCIYSYENELFFNETNNLFYESLSSNKTL